MRRHRPRQIMKYLSTEELQAPEVAAEIEATTIPGEEGGDAAVVGVPDFEPSDVESELDAIEATNGDTVAVTNAIETADTIEDNLAALEAIVGERAPTKYELMLIEGAGRRAMRVHDADLVGLSSMESFEGMSEEESNAAQLARAAELKVALEDASEGVWGAIKKAMAKVGAVLGSLWKKFVFALKTHSAQVQQFRRELESSETDAKVQQLTVGTRVGHYTGVGNGGDPVALVTQLEDANEYIYRDLFHKLATFSSTGEGKPEVDDDKFLGLPGEPRIRITPRGAQFIENPPRVQTAVIPVPEKATVMAWIDAFLKESMYYIENYDAFKSTAEKVYDAARDRIENEDLADAAEAGGKIMFARTHACIETMENWIRYTMRFMISYHALLMGLRKAYI